MSASNLGHAEGSIGLDIADALRKGELFKSMLRSIQGAGETAARGLSGLSGALSAPFGAIKSLTSALGGIGVASLGVKAIADSVLGVTKALIGGNAQMETYETQLGTLLGSADAAKQRLAELAKFGANTPFELPEVVKAEKVLLGFGLSGQHAIDITKRNGDQLRTLIGDIAAGTGAGFDEIALNVGRFGAGATGEAIARFQELGIVTREQLTALGVEFDKGGALLSPLPAALSAALDIAEKKFGGGMDKLSGTVSGKLSNLSDAITQNTNRLTQGVFKLAGPLVDALNSMLGSEDFGKTIDSISTAIGTTLSGAVDTAVAAYRQLAPVAQAAVDAVKSLVSTGDISGFVANVEKIFKLQPGALEPLRAVIQNVRDAIVTFIAAASGNWTPSPGIQLFHQIIGAIGLLIPRVRDAVLTFIGALQGNWQPAPGIDLFNQVIGTLGRIIGGVQSGVETFIGFLSGGSGASGQTTMLQNFLAAAQKVSDFIGGPAYDALKTFIGALQGDWKPADGIGAFALAAGNVATAIKDIAAQVAGAIDGTQKFADALTSNVPAMTAISALLAGIAAGLFLQAAAAAAAAIASGAETVALWAMIAADNALAVAQGLLNAVMSANPIALIVIALVAAAAAVIYLYNNFAPFREAVNAAWTEVQKAAAVIGAFGASVVAGVTPGLQAAGAALGGFVSSVGDFFGRIGETIADGGVERALTDAWQDAGTIVSDALSGIGSAISSAFQAASEAVGSAMTSVGSAIGGAFQGAADVVGGAVGSIAAVIAAVIAIVVGFGAQVGQTFEALPGVVVGGVTAIADAIGGAFNGVVALVSEALTAVADVVSSIWNGIVATIQGVGASISDAVGSAWNGMVSLVSDALSAVRDVILGVWNQIPEDIRADLVLISTVLAERFANTLAAAIAWVAGVASSIAEGFGSLVGSVSSAIGGVVAAIASGFGDAVSAVSEAVGSVASAVGDAFSGVTEAVGSALGDVASTVGSAFDAVGSTIGDAIGTFAGIAQEGWDAVSGVFTAATAAVIGVVTGWADELTGSLSASFDGTVEATSSAWDMVSSTIAGAVSAVQSVVASAFDAVSSVVLGVLSTVESAVSSTWNNVVAIISQAVADFVDIEVRGWTIILTTITDALTAALDAITGWAAPIVQIIGDAMSSLLSSVQEAWNGVVTAITDAVNSGINAVSTFANQMGDAVGRAASAVGAAAASIGSAIVDGIVSGVTNAASALGGALGGVVRQALGFVKNVADIHSPSGLFAREVGAPMGEGIVQGLESVDLPGVMRDLIQLVSDAGAQIGGKANVDRFKSIADAISGAAGAVQSSLQALSGIAGFVRPSVEQLIELRGAMGDVLDQMSRLGVGINQKVADRIKLVADAAGGALTAFGNAIQALSGASQFQGAGEHQLALVANGIENVLGHLADIGTRYTGQQFAVITAVAQAAGAAASALASALKPLTDVNDFTGVGDSQLAKAIDGIEAVIGRMADLADRFPRSALAPVQALGATIEAAFAAVNASLAPLTGLRSFVAPSADLDALFTNISGVLVRMRDLSLAFTREQAKLTEDVSSASQAAFNAVARALEVLPALSRVSTLGNVDVAMGVLRDRITLVVGSLRDAAVALGSGAAKQAGDFAENAGKVFDLVSSAIDAVRRLSDLPDVADINRSVKDLADRVISIVKTIDRAATVVGVDAARSAAAFAEGAGKVVALIGDGIDAVTKLSDFRLGDISGAIDKLATGIVAVVKGVAKASSDIGETALSDAALMTENAGKIVDLVKSAVDALSGLGKFAGIPAKSVAALGTALIAAVGEIVRVTRAVGDTLTDSSVVAAERIQKALGILGVAVDFSKLADFKAPSRQQIDAFFNVLRVAVARLVEQAKPIAGEISEQMGEVGENIGKAFGGLKNAVDFFLAAQDFNPGKGFAEKLGGIVGLLGPVLTAFKGLASGFQDIEPLVAFATAVGAIAKALSDFVDAASKASAAKGDLGAILNVIQKAREALQLAATASAGAGQTAAPSVSIPSEIHLIFSGGIEVAVKGVEGAPGVAAQIAGPTRDEIQAQTFRLLAEKLAG